jgi:ribonuclease-3
MTARRDVLTAHLGHSFSDLSLLRRALTHASAGDAASSYERLEFLGDRVVGLVLAEILLTRFPDELEGDISRRHAKLVSREALADIAATIDLGDHMIVASGDARAGLRGNTAVLADTMEAVLGALYLDAGLAAAARFITAAWEPLIQADVAPPRDAKTSLQEWVQARAKALPRYHLVDRVGSDHEPLFRVAVQVPGADEIMGEGRSKRAAEQAAAGKMLDHLRTRARGCGENG